MIKRKGQFKKGHIPASKTHGMRKTRFYGIWAHLLERCSNKNTKDFKNYGGRGIKCLWESFEDFRDDMYKGYLEHIKEFGKKQTQIDRIDNNGHYCKDNCRWVTLIEQARNRRSNHLITFKGKTMCISEWSKKLNINGETLRCRIDRYGWSVEKAFTVQVTKF